MLYLPKSYLAMGFSVKRFLPTMAAVLVGVALVTGVLAPARATEGGGAESTITFGGGGWGHSVGLSQYGAQGQALSGRDHRTILASYFTGVGFDSFTTNGGGIEHPGTVWVGIDQDLTELTFRVRGTAPDAHHVTVTRGQGEAAQRVDILPGNSFTIAFEPEFTYEVQGETVTSPAGCTLTVQNVVWPAGGCFIDIDWDGWEHQPTTVVDIGARSYRYGNLHVRPNHPPAQAADGYHLVAAIGLEKYLYGIAEVPHSWHPEALRTQAVAARSYAANKMALRGHPGASDFRQDLCWCQLYDDTRDQFWVGWPAEVGAWRQAVDATAGVVLAHREVVESDGPVAVPTFYSSSTFGHTEDSGIAFGSGFTPEYLRGVPDPWSVDPIAANPYATWTKTMAAADVATRLGMDSVTGAEITAWSPASGAALEITFTGLVESVPSERTFTTPRLRSKLGLRSMQVTGLEVDIVEAAPGGGGPAPPQPDQVALQDPTSGVWSLRHGDGTVSGFYYGVPGDVPMACDWNADRLDTVGLYRQSDGFLYLRNSNDLGVADVAIYYGVPEDLPVCGDWNGDGMDTIGIYRPSEGKFYLRNTNTQGFADVEFFFGLPGVVPLAGDWNGDGRDSVGVYDPATQILSLANGIAAPAADVEWHYEGARPGDRLITGDWDGDGLDTPGVYRPADRTFYLRDTLTQPAANHLIEMGAEHLNPVAGHWGG